MLRSSHPAYQKNTAKELDMVNKEGGRHPIAFCLNTLCTLYKHQPGTMLISQYLVDKM